MTEILRKDFIGPLMPKGYNPVPKVEIKSKAKRQGVGDLKLVKDIIDDTKAKELDATIEHAKEQSALVAKILSLKEELRDLEAKLDKPISKSFGYKKPINQGIGDYIRTQIFEGLGNKEILAKVHETTGNINTTYACVAWYRNDMRVKGLI